jgi:hypothetical protein
MSCFQGRVEELKNVSVDCFENSNIYSTTFFLSHCHTGIYYRNRVVKKVCVLGVVLFMQQGLFV